MEEHGYDGTDQLFVSSPQYHERPELLLEKIRHNVGDVKNPETTAEELRRKRCQVQERYLREANCCEVSKIRRRNQTLDHIAWIRNAPKLFSSELFAAIWTGTLSMEAQLFAGEPSGRAGVTSSISRLKRLTRRCASPPWKLLCPQEEAVLSCEAGQDMSIPCRLSLPHTRGQCSAAGAGDTRGSRDLARRHLWLCQGAQEPQRETRKGRDLGNGAH